MPHTDTLRQILADTLGVDAAQITDDFGPADCGNWDSLATLRMVTAVEDALGIRFTMEEITLWTKFSAIRAAVQRHLDEKSAG